MTRRLLLAAALVGLAACSADKPKPTPLESYTPAINVRAAWNLKLDDVPFELAPVVREGEVTLAGADGTVVTVDAASGRELRRANAGARLSAAVGSDGRISAAVTRDNEVVAIEDGRVKWRQRFGARVTTPPLVAGERVFVMGVDRVVQAYDAFDGRKLWTLQRPGDALTLSQAGVVAAFKDTLLVGQGALLTGVDPLRGTVRWEVAIAQPRGTNEVERLADLVGPALRVGDVVCVRAFQSAVGCADAQSGTLKWTKNVGGTQAIGGDGTLVFGADASDRITAWRADSGDVAWTSEHLLHRALSAPLAAGKAVVFGDSEGQVHFLDRDSGATIARMSTDGSAIVGRPVLAGGTIVVVTRKGGVYAYAAG